MSLDRRAIALQGVGFGRRLLAFQGLRPAAPPAPETGVGGAWMARPKKKRRRDDDEVLLFLIR